MTAWPQPRADAPAGTSRRAVLPVKAEGLVFERGGRRLIDGIDLDLSGDSRLTVILGPNGAGKTLTLRLIAGLIAPDGGRVTWAGTSPDRARAPRLGIVFQAPVLLRRSAVANVEYALGAAGVPGRARRQAAMGALAWADLADLAGAPARELSGGEKQRLALARALAMGPEMLLLDEPASNIDPPSTLAIEGLIAGARQAGTKVVLVTHDLAQARRLADDVVFLHRGRVVERAPAAEFFAAPVSAAAGAFLAGAIVV